ncbi:MAG: hypothetical protein HOK25_17810 [Rhodospirillaceae bacterium]|nr:hypothetical protein [Rhodospirillaceae bacterium]MBT5300440.1 hypothetical protein [Rhodospirillaceae bacterium]MBT5515914.1 hypothetical protein [Rhodospirillaceae bacterium]MBT6086343.1 hypothetical protein [Rhodospirillaceae bacterium]
MFRMLPLAIYLSAALFIATPDATAETLRVDDWVRSSRVAALALEDKMSKAMRLAGRIQRVDVRDGAFAKLAVIAARKAKLAEARDALARISGRGRHSDAVVEVGIALARLVRLNAAENLAFALGPKRRDEIRAVIAMVQAERKQIKLGWNTARRSGDLPRRRQSLVTLRGGLSRSISAKAAIGAALGAETHNGRIQSLIAVARGLVLGNQISSAITALSWARQIIRQSPVDPRVAEQAVADTAMILADAGDIEGARQAVRGVKTGALRRFLLHHINENWKFLPY